MFLGNSHNSPQFPTMTAAHLSEDHHTPHIAMTDGTKESIMKHPSSSNKAISKLWMCVYTYFASKNRSCPEVENGAVSCKTKCCQCSASEKSPTIFII